MPKLTTFIDKPEFQGSRADLSIQWLSQFEAGFLRDDIQVARLEVRWERTMLVVSDPEHMRLRLKAGLSAFLGSWLLPNHAGLTMLDESNQKKMVEVYYHQRPLNPTDVPRLRMIDDSFYGDDGTKLGRVFSAWKNEDVERDILFHVELAEACEPRVAIFGAAAIATHLWPRKPNHRIDTFLLED